MAAALAGLAAILIMAWQRARASPVLTRKPVWLFQADFGGAVAVVGDDGDGGEEGLGEGAGEAFAVAGVAEGVHGGEDARDFGGGDEAGEGDAVLPAFLLEDLFEAGAVDAVADPEEVGVGDLGEEFGGDGEEVVVPFERLEAGDGAEDESVLRDVELGADLFAGGAGVEEGFDFHGAVDGGVEVGAADAGGEGLAGHGVGDGDDGVAAFGGVAFGGDPGGVEEFVLVGVEGEAVDGVDDEGTSFEFRVSSFGF